MLFSSKECKEKYGNYYQINKAIQAGTLYKVADGVYSDTPRVSELEIIMYRYPQTVPFIIISKDGFDWYLRFDGDPDKPLHCQLQGKRKTNTKIVVSGACSPSMDSSPTGCSEGLRGYRVIGSNNPTTTAHGLRTVGGFAEFP